MKKSIIKKSKKILKELEGQEVERFLNDNHVIRFWMKLSSILVYFFGRPIFYEINRGLALQFMKHIGFWNIIESGEDKILLKYKSKLKHIFDVGSHFGESFMKVLHTLDEIKSYHGFEANPISFKKLQKTVAEFPEIPATINNLAIGAEEGVLTLWDNDLYVKDSGSACTTAVGNIYKKHEKSNLTKIEAKQTTLDNYLEKNPNLKCDLLKVDVEGWEGKVFKGAQNFIKQLKPKIIIFEHNFPILFKNPTILQEFEESFPEYTLYRILRNGVVKISDLSRKEQMLEFTIRQYYGFSNILAKRK